MHVCLSVSPTPASPFSVRFVSSLSIFLSPSLHSRSLSRLSPPYVFFLSSLLSFFPLPRLFLEASFYFAPPPLPPPSPRPSIFCPAEGWLRGLREAACPGHRDGTRVRGPLRAPSGSRAGGAPSLPPARRPGLRRPNNGHIVLAAHRPPPASGGRPDPARGGSGRKPAAQIQIGRPWRRVGDRSAPALTWGRRFSLPTAAGPPSLFPVAPHPLLREEKGIHSTLGDSLQSQLRAFH